MSSTSLILDCLPKSRDICVFSGRLKKEEYFLCFFDEFPFWTDFLLLFYQRYEYDHHRDREAEVAGTTCFEKPYNLWLLPLDNQLVVVVDLVHIRQWTQTKQYSKK